MLIPIIIHLRAKFDDRLLLKLSISLSRSNSSVMRIHCVFVFVFVFLPFLLLFCFITSLRLHVPINQFKNFFFPILNHMIPYQAIFFEKISRYWYWNQIFQHQYRELQKVGNSLKTELSHSVIGAPNPTPKQAKPKQIIPFLLWGFPTPMRESSVTI